jgi:hypothetical protein
MADFVVEVGLEGRVGWADDFLRPAFRASPIRGGRSDALEALTLQTERHAHATHAADLFARVLYGTLESQALGCGYSYYEFCPWLSAHDL